MTTDSEDKMRKILSSLFVCLLLVSVVTEQYAIVHATTNPMDSNIQENKPESQENFKDTTEITPFANTYTVKFFDWDNTLLGLSQTINEGESAIAPTVPNRPGYKFTGWSADFSSVTQNMDIYAQYEPLVNYTVTINYIFSDSTIALQPVIYSVEKGGSLNETVITPSIPGFAPDQNQVVLNLSDVQQNYTYTVTFVPAANTPYKVEHYQQNLVPVDILNPANPSNFTLVDTENLTGPTASLVTATAKTYIGFTPPSTMPSAQIAADGGTTLKTYYTRNQYAFYFNSAGGTYVAPIAALYGASVTPPAAPTRPGYSFTGWSSPVPATMPANDLTFTANWTPSGASNYNVVYWLENIESSGYDYVGTAPSSGTAGSAPVIPASVPGSVTFPIPSTYYSYNSTKTISEKPATINGDGTTIVNVYYDRNSYTLDFNFDASKYKLVVGSTTYTTSPYTLTAKFGSRIYEKWPGTPTLLPGKTGDGNFVGWNGGGINYVTMQFNLDAQTINNNPFTANWDPNSKMVTVNYYFQNITGGGYTPNFGQTVAARTNATQWNAKTFLGFTVQATPLPIPASNIVDFYYTRNMYNISYYNNGVIDKTISNVLYQDTISGSQYNYIPPKPANVPSDYVFKGWYKTPQGYDGSEFNFSGATMPAYNLILYSKWEKPNYTVNFNPANGDPNFSQTVPSLNTLVPPADPVKPGYIFGGWYKTGETLKYVFDFPVTSNFTLTARWIPVNNITYDVVHMKDGVEYLRQSYGSKSVGDSVTASAMTIPGYLPDATSKNLTLQASGNEIVFNYTPFSSVGYTVRYVDESNQPILADKTATSNQASVTENYVNIPGMYPNYYQQTLQLTPNPSQNIITFVYKETAPVKYLVRTYLQNLDGSYAMTEVEKSAPAGSVATEPPQTITGYTYQPQLSLNSRVVATNGSTVLYLFYNRDVFDINFTTQGPGTLSGTPIFDDVKYQTPFGSAGVVPTPVPDPGYKFDGWQPTLPAAGDLITADATYTAVFSKDPSQWATITYDGNTHTSGTMPPSTDLLIGTTFTLPANAFVKDNYDFLNWDTAPNATGDYTYFDQQVITVIGDMTLYAQWSPHDKWRVAYINNGGIGDMHDDTEYWDEELVTVQNNTLTRPGYTFKEWQTPSGTVYHGGDTFNIQEDTMLIAQWEYDPSQWVTVSYDKNHPMATGIMTEDTLLMGSDYPTKPNGFSLSNYTFTGWNTAADGSGSTYGNGSTISSISSSVTLYAQWQENPKYTVTYMANNGTLDTVTDTPTYGDVMKTAFPNDTFSYEHYDFIRWNTSPDGTGDTYLAGSSFLPTDNVTLYAIWKPRNLYVITYLDGFSTGTFTDSEYADAEGFLDITVENNPYIRPGYVFKDWISNTSSICYPGNIVENISSNMTYTAEWDPITYQIQYHLEGGTVNGTNPTDYNIETPTFELINPTKPGYTFTGWTKDGSEPTTPNDHMIVGQGSMGNLSFTANWVKDPSQWSTITFVNSDPSKGSLSGTLEYEGIKGETTGAAVNYPTTTGAKGYKVDQWDQVIPTEYPETDMTITVSWVKDPSQWSTITFINSDPSKGTLGGTVTYEGIKGEAVENTVVYPNTTGATGFEFDYWSQVIPTDYPNENLTITAYWKATADPVPPEPGPNPVNPSGMAKTGDQTSILGWSIMAFSSMIILVAMYLRRFRRTSLNK